MNSSVHGRTSLTLLAALGALWAAFDSPAAPATQAAAVATPAATTGAAASQAEHARRAAPGRASLLLSPFGSPLQPSADLLPADAGVRTRNGLYAARQQAEDIERQLGGVAWVVVDCCGDAALDVAQGVTHGLMAAEDLAADAPVFVSGANLQQAARLVDRLSAQGLTRVHLVTR